MAEVVVCNSSPLIALSQIGQLDILLHFYGQVYVSPVVVRETTRSLQPPAWIIERPLRTPVDQRIQARALGPGESETLALALELGATLAIVDDKPARELARTVGTPVVGTLGVLVKAKQTGHVAVLRPLLDSLLQHRFFMSPELYEHTLRVAGE